MAVKIILDGEGIRELLKSQEIEEECRTCAEKVLEACGEHNGYKMERREYPERTGYAVYADEYPAIQDNLSNNTLVKAVSK